MSREAAQVRKPPMAPPGAAPFEHMLLQLDKGAKVLPDTFMVSVGCSSALRGGGCSPLAGASMPSTFQHALL